MAPDATVSDDHQHTIPRPVSYTKEPYTTFEKSLLKEELPLRNTHP